MQKLTPIQILDKVLFWFALDIDTYLETPSQHFNENISKPEAITEIGRCYKELRTLDFFMYAGLIIDKLVRDGYLKNNDGLLSITFEGKLFSKNGGYIKSFNDAKSESRIKMMKENLLIWGTWLAGIGSSVLVLWEIYKHYFLHVD